MQLKKNNFNSAIRDPGVPTQLELSERLEPLEQAPKHPFREPMLFRIASAYEIATRHRMSPGCSIARHLYLPRDCFIASFTTPPTLEISVIPDTEARNYIFDLVFLSLFLPSIILLTASLQNGL
jgi:hypothetical protein